MMMKISAALLVVACVVPSSMGQRCGPGTYHDSQTNMCLVGDKPSARTARAGDSQPSIDTEDGNVIIAVNGAGDQIGFRIGDKVTYFDEMATDIRGQIPAVNLGYSLGVAAGKAASGSLEILDYLKTDLSDRVEKIDGAQSEIEQSVQRSLDAAKSNTDKQLSDAAAASKTQLADQKKDVDGKISGLNTKVAADLKSAAAATAAALLAADKSVTAKVASVSTYGKSLVCLNANLKFNPEDGKCCKVGESWNVKEKKCKLPPSFGGEQGNQNIMTPEAMKPLWIRIGRPSMKPMKLCFSSKRDGWSSSKFHNNCDNQGRLFSVQRMKTGRVFGGYMHTSMSSCGCSKRSAYNSVDSAVVTGSGWLFRVNPGNDKAIDIYAHKARGQGSGYYQNPSYIMTWGGGHDLTCEQHFNHCYSNLGHNYGGPTADISGYSSTKNHNALAGKYNWNARNEMSDYEVYLVKDQ